MKTTRRLKTYKTEWYFSRLLVSHIKSSRPISKQLAFYWRKRYKSPQTFHFHSHGEIRNVKFPLQSEAFIRASIWALVIFKTISNFLGKKKQIPTYQQLCENSSTKWI